jgi:Cu/Ag efflux protein CusF
MTTAKTILAGTAAFAILSSAAFAQETKQAPQQDSQTGILTKIDRLHGSVTIQHEEKQSGTVGVNAGSGGEEFKAQRGLSLEDVHVGDKITYSTTGTGDGRTVTKIQKQKE